MTDALGIETRSRSRSKTPGLLFSENGDSEKKGAKKIPTISLIEEEDDVEIVPSSQPSQNARPKRQRRSAKADASADVPLESPKMSQNENIAKVQTFTTTTFTETVKKTINGSGEASEQYSSTTVAKSASNDDAIEGQSIFNNIFNAIKTSTPILSNKRSKRVTQSVTSPAVSVADHPAYKEYKEAGEYWNKYPKTDYTYSELSPHRRELSNGVVAMPNMSRRSLEKYQNRVEVMIQNNPLEESFLRRKFLNASSSFQKRSTDLQYDSADEVDLSELRRQLQTRRKPADTVVSRFFLMIINFINSSYYSAKQGVRRIFYKANDRYAYTPIRDKKQGILRRTFESFKKFMLLGFSKVYLFVSTVLCLDTWILYTRSENAIMNSKRRRFLLSLLILLPLLLLGGICIYLDPPKTIIFPKISLPKLRFPTITLPGLPKLSLPSISWPSFLTLTWPTFNFSWSSFSLPEISFAWLAFSRPAWLRFPAWSWPDWSFQLSSWSVNLPDWSLSWPQISFSWFQLSRPEWLEFPDISWPQFSLPSISWPNISLPIFSLPSFPSFDFSSLTGYIGDKYIFIKESLFEGFDKIREVTVGMLNEAQIVWNENFTPASSPTLSSPVINPGINSE